MTNNGLFYWAYHLTLHNSSTPTFAQQYMCFFLQNVEVILYDIVLLTTSGDTYAMIRFIMISCRGGTIHRCIDESRYFSRDTYRDTYRATIFYNHNFSFF